MSLPIPLHPALRAAALLCIAPAAHAGVTVATARGTADFQFQQLPAPALDDAAAGATIEVVDGRPDPHGAAAATLLDGRLPATDDQPAGNFFFAAGTDGGRLLLDLGRPVEIASVASYSWHRAERGPQVYTLYAATGDEPGFNPRPARPLPPAQAGWKPLAKVDTRPGQGPWGGQHAALIRNPDSPLLGRFRYLLFDIRRTEDHDTFGNTFFSALDVTDARAPAPRRFAPLVRSRTSPDGRLRYHLDLTDAPDLAPWADSALLPVVAEWYPKIAALLASPGHTPPAEVHIAFREDTGGAPAYAAGNRLTLSIPFFRAQLNGEAKGCVVHELVHVVQAYGQSRRANRTPTPGWLVEGIADYIRWFLYEPQSKGAEITRRNLPNARYDASYRISANFLDWVIRTHDKNLLAKLNTAARQGRYSPAIWQSATGLALDELGARWLDHHHTRLNPPPAAKPPG